MHMDENKLFLDEDLCSEDDCVELSLEDASPEELDQLWDDADDEFEVCASKKICDKKKCIIAAIIAGVAIAVIGFIVYKVVKSRKD